MQQDQQNHKFSYRSLSIEYCRVTLHLHRNFTTAHSTSAIRNNFFIKVGAEHPQVQSKLHGFGQCGLPPKKPGCYLSDINDCFNFMKQLENKLKQEDIDLVLQVDWNIKNVPENINQFLNSLKSPLKSQIIHFLKILQGYQETECFRAPKCALQFALLDFLCKIHKKTMTELLFNQVQKNHKSYSFYTASLQQNSQMIQNIKSHLSITHYIKLKYDNNITNLVQLLNKINQIKYVNKIIIDANCSWKVQDVQNLVAKIKKLNNGDKILQKILYIEQPFDLDINDFDKWKQLKKKSPIKILADQSFKNEKDVQKIKIVAHAVNIKTQKTGGVMGTLRAAIQAKKEGLQVMFGSMCSTQLGCTQTFQFYPFSQYLDIDGALLVKEPSLQGGFKWKQGGLVYPYHQGYGLRINCQEIFTVNN